MNALVPQAVLALTEARDLLLSQSQEAASQGCWAHARKLMELAERADRLREEVQGLTTAGLAETEQENRLLQATPEDELSPRGIPAREGYPKYVVRDGALVKLGLQRDGHNVYEHAVPQEHFDQLVRQLTDMAATRTHGKQRPFTVEDVQKGVRCPRYMTYAAVSLFVREGLIVRARKGSYTFAAPATFANAAAALWIRLKGASAS
jgi:hypothetical protein